MNRLIAVLLTPVLVCCLAGCAGTRIVHCDHCGEEIVLPKNHNIQEDWIVFCQDCEEDLFGDDPVISPGK